MLVHTRQHDDEMSGIFFEEIGLPAPDHNLEVGSGTHAVQTAEVMKRLEPVLDVEAPDWALVVGDVNSTLAPTLVVAAGVALGRTEQPGRLELWGGERPRVGSSRQSSGALRSNGSRFVFGSPA